MDDEKTIQCSVCTEEKKPFSIITCPKCDYQACRTCTKKFLLGINDINPFCMNCKTQWDFEFLATNTDNSFHNRDYRLRRATILLEREKSLLPATQPYVQEIEENKKREAQIAEIQKEIDRYYTLIRECEGRIRALKQSIRGGNSERKANLYRFIGFCPQKDCRGFLDIEYTCGICNEKACRICRQQRHTGPCDEDTVKTIHLLRDDTRPCPNCSVPIHRVLGCNQMYCTMCHTPFDWVTGRITTGRIHNPHYFEWMRQHGHAERDPLDIPCGGRVDFPHEVHRLRRKDLKYKEWLFSAYQMSAHVRDVYIPMFTVQNVDDGTNRDLRIRYLMNEIDEEEWRALIAKREKRREKMRALNFIIVALCDMIDTILDNIIRQPERIDTWILELLNFQAYIQGQFERIERRFNNKVPRLGTNWSFAYGVERNCFKGCDRKHVPILNDLSFAPNEKTSQPKDD